MLASFARIAVIAESAVRIIVTSVIVRDEQGRGVVIERILLATIAITHTLTNLPYEWRQDIHSNCLRGLEHQRRES